MIRNTKTAALMTLLVLVSAACAASEETSDPTAGLPTVEALCAEETVDCDDMVIVAPGATPITEPGDPGPPPPGASSSSGMVAGDGLSVSAALQSDATGPRPLAVRGFYLDDGSGARLCETLAESFPPQCGGARLPLSGLAADDLGSLQNAGSTTWSDQPVTILGELIDGTLVATPFSI